MRIAALTDIQIRNAVPRDKPYKLTDGRGLYLLVHSNGGKYWRYDYAVYGKRKTLALGIYPYIGLKEARQRHFDAKVKLAHGEDPGLKPMGSTFEVVANEWIERRLKNERSEATVATTKFLLAHVAYLNGMEIAAIKAPDVLRGMRKLESQGKLESAKRVRSVVSRVLRYAIATGRAEKDVASDLSGAISAPKVRHRSAPLTPEKIGALMRAISEYTGSPSVVAALRLSALTFLRPSEIRFALWDEIDVEGAIWSIPAHRMKMKRPHLVPLSRQAVRAISRLGEVHKQEGYLFPSPNKAGKPIGEMTVISALRLMGFSKDDISPHGFRRMASTILNERGWNRDWIERQLAHAEPNQVRKAYNAAEYLEGRTEMMQAWADLLDDFEIQDMIG